MTRQKISKWNRWLRTKGHTASQWLSELLDEPFDPVSRQYTAPKTNLFGRGASTPQSSNFDNAYRTLFQSSQTAHEVWDFLLERLSNGIELPFATLSFVDEERQCLDIRFIRTASESIEPKVSLPFTHSCHLTDAIQRSDTTFTVGSHRLGKALANFLSDWPSHQADNLKVFSIPFLANGEVIALLTLGFHDVDTFVQSKLSYVYSLKDLLAQLLWNLQLKEQIQTQASQHGLTGLNGYHAFQEQFAILCLHARQQQAPLNLALIDIHTLETINKNHSHDVGDQLLRHIANHLKETSTPSEYIACLGGDDFAWVLPDKRTDEAKERIQDFLNTLEPAPIPVDKCLLSIGLAQLNSLNSTPDKLIKAAEEARQLACYQVSQSEQSEIVAYRELDQLNEKTMFDAFATRLARKYQHGSLTHTIYSNLLHHIQPHQGKSDTPAEEPLLSLNVSGNETDTLMLETIGSLAGALEAKDRYTRGHSQAVANYALTLAHALNLPEQEVEQIRIAALLHDIGKIGIPEAILNKTGKLNEKEWDVMRQHPVIGARQILSPVSLLEPMLPLVEFHHERWDGTGYPNQLQGKDIPLGARIIAIADVFDALTSDRAYRKALPIEEAKHIMEQGSGTQFDPELLTTFFSVLEVAQPSIAA